MTSVPKEERRGQDINNALSLVVHPLVLFSGHEFNSPYWDLVTLSKDMPQ